MKTKAFLEYIESLKTIENSHILGAVQDAVIVIMLPDEDEKLPIKNRFTLNKNKATGEIDKSTDTSKIDLSDDETNTLLVTQLAGNLFNTD